MVGFYKCFKYDYVTADLLLEVLSAAPFLIKRHHSRGALPASFLFYLYFLIPFYALIDVIPPPPKKKDPGILSQQDLSLVRRMEHHVISDLLRSAIAIGS